MITLFAVHGATARFTRIESLLASLTILTRKTKDEEEKKKD